VLKPNLAFSPALSAICPRPGSTTRSHADERFHAELLGDGDNLAQLLELLDYHDDLLVQLVPSSAMRMKLASL